MDNNNRGSLFRNDKKGNEKAPDYTGKAVIDGVEMRHAAWIKSVPGKDKFTSLKFTPADERPAPPAQGPAPSEDDMPF